MTICIVGLGYVGFPLALHAASKGMDVVGVDTDSEKLRKISEGQLGVDDQFTTHLIKNTTLKLSKTVVPADIFVVCVPTPVNHDKDPDLGCVIDAVKNVSTVIEDGNLVVIESTIYPGVCEELLKPILEKTGKKYYLGHCPERINPGDEKWNVSNIPRVVGGIDQKSTELTAEFYSQVVSAEITAVSEIKAAEATKILENTFRDVNIAFINEMAESFYRLGIDTNEVIKGASSKPFGFMPHYPGIGVGGHCIAVDPYYMIKKGSKVGFDHGFLIHARRINNEMPAFTVGIVQEELNKLGYPVKGTPITVLGLSYKPDVADDRESPSYELIKILKKKEADLTLFDPYLPEKSTAESLKEALNGSVCVVIATAHKEFRDNSLYKNAKLVVDGRNCLDKKIVRDYGLVYKGIGVSA
jgi:nucleotide sugar dehydrogenase